MNYLQRLLSLRPESTCSAAIIHIKFAVFPTGQFPSAESVPLSASPTSSLNIPSIVPPPGWPVAPRGRQPPVTSRARLASGHPPSPKPAGTLCIQRVR